jgi:hypothetical protein
VTEREATTSSGTKPRIGVIGLVPAQEFATFLRGLRSRYPEAAVTAVIGSPELHRDGAADEYLMWGSLGARALLGEIRRRRFDLLAVPYNREYLYTFTFWKALLLAVLSRTRALLFCEQAQLPERLSLQALGRPRALAGALLSAAWNMVAQPLIFLAREAVIIAVSSLLILVVAGIIVVDGWEAVTRAVARRGRNRRRR